jgi:membrane-bound metal-dependent hydrolase YbcI (DUF457 family)
MSGIGHLAAGFAAKPAAPQAPLWILLAASEVNELVYLGFTAVGIEQPAQFTLDFQQGVKYLSQGSNPWSHGLFMSIIWSVVAAGLAFLFYHHRRPACVIGLVVFSHWVLDFLMHANLLILFDGSPLVGLALENSGPGLIFMTVLDLCLLAAGVTIYLVNQKRTTPAACER